MYFLYTYICETKIQMLKYRHTDTQYVSHSVIVIYLQATTRLSGFRLLTLDVVTLDPYY